MFGLIAGYHSVKAFIIIHTLLVCWRTVESTYQMSLNPHGFHRNSFLSQKIPEEQHYSGHLKTWSGDTMLEIQPDAFFRNTKAEDNARLMTIDLSALNQGLLPSGGGLAHRMPMKLMGIDVSVLHHNPEPSLPVVQTTFPDMPPLDDTVVYGDPLESYDRFPVVKDNMLQEGSDDFMDNENRPSVLNTEENDIEMFPLLHLPFKAMSAYHRILTESKKQETDWKFLNRLSTKPKSQNQLPEHERKHIAKFVSQLLDSLTFRRPLKRSSMMPRPVELLVKGVFKNNG